MEVASHLNVSYATFREWCARGPACPAVPTPYYRTGGQLRWRREEVADWVSHQQVRSS